MRVPSINRVMAEKIEQINAATTGKPIRRLRSRKRIIFDLLCGKCNVAKYYLRVDSNATIICVDKRDPRDALSEIPAHMLARIRYVQMDAESLTYEKLLSILHEHFPGVGIKDVYHIHASPDCTTMSTAHSAHSKYRLADGTIDPALPQ